MIPNRSNDGDTANGTVDDAYYVLADGHVGRAIAETLQANDQHVTIVAESHESNDIPGFAGDPSALDVLSESGIDAASTVIVATASDRRNLLVAQLVRTHFDVPRVIALVNHPDRTPLFTAAGHEPFCVTTVLSDAVGEAI